MSQEKLSVAVRDNINTVIIPRANKRDVAKIPAEIRDVLTIIHISQLANYWILFLWIRNCNLYNKIRKYAYF
ncbi:S16 family serine protease [Candidatus Tisiphia endosymbiont of Ditula angustiorana]|uniref:S16 family serine protease n=1 Tax=Candidatus Tisiphia endosymbiont of Ditula angustiorana TaxID=3066272 RepID=UPI003977BF65